MATHKRTQRRNQFKSLPLFDWADRERLRKLRGRRVPIAERKLTRDWGIAPSHARLIAELQGYGDRDGEA